MTKPIARDPIYRKQVFDADIIELCVRWCITYRLSYRDLVQMTAERCVSVAGFKSFDNAAVTIAGTELAHRIRKNQFSFGRGRRRRSWSRKADWAMALA